MWEVNRCRNADRFHLWDQPIHLGNALLKRKENKNENPCRVKRNVSPADGKRKRIKGKQLRTVYPIFYLRKLSRVVVTFE
jgi:hypothetical protein